MVTIGAPHLYSIYINNTAFGTSSFRPSQDSSYGVSVCETGRVSGWSIVKCKLCGEKLRLMLNGSFKLVDTWQDRVDFVCILSSSVAHGSPVMH